MYTDEQAREAIAKQMLKDMEKEHNLRLHEWAIEEQTTYNLPYRVLFNYYKSDRDYMEIPINPYYPYPDIPKEYKPPRWNPERDGGYTTSEWFSIISKPTGEIDENGKRIYTFEVPKEIQDKIDEWQAEKVRERTRGEYHHIWDLDTEQGRQAWLYWFMVFIMPYADDIPHWNSFDMYGDTKHTEQELNERKRYYMNLIEQCREHPELYKHEVQHKDIADYDKYDFDDRMSWGYMWHDDFNHEPPQGDNALEIMYKERERLKRYYGENYDIFEVTDRNSMSYRVEEIIKKLETERGLI